jgi:hypothetical protein
MKAMKRGGFWGCLLLILGTCWLLPLSDACAREVDGVSFPDEVTIGQTSCKLVGVGLRKKFVVDVYYGALYMRQPTQDAARVISSDQPKRVVLHVVYKEVEAGKWVEGWQEGFSKNVPAMDAALKEKIDLFLKCFKEPVKKGEEVQITYVPDVGTEVMIKGKPQATIPGREFMTALWSIWFGKEPASESLMKGMLGK